ncbi:hypothetical protein HOK68_04195 [Candidatus Woesearchaeota archaeon]|jgi:nitroreductase|nr:hypothetical protein [Candidatus Woesearchaeota archaeon]MBT4387706.1 hypothetical protein [Candidatus Woesearchaeota archaeon]MBT4595885.1 hypothetical protein [Candidatus Woesearchaeota archaeon]MBT5740771.1 hypothetical protein [Candidatus Woesearchaeota archaeon]MBT6505951.1 hypothetical protein [Candidatus Woesearchaeota archaeon]
MDENILKRRSCKNYLQIPIEWSKLVNILKAGSLAPSAGNLQNWKFIVIQEKENRQKIANSCLFQTWMNQAPTYIIVCGNFQMAQKYYFERGNMFTIQSCAAAMENMLIEATNQKLGSNWVGAFDEQKLNEILEIEDEWKIYSILTLGYESEKTEMPNKLELKDQVYFEKFKENQYEASLFPISNLKNEINNQINKTKSEIIGQKNKIQKKIEENKKKLLEE